MTRRGAMLFYSTSSALPHANDRRRRGETGRGNSGNTRIYARREIQRNNREFKGFACLLPRVRYDVSVCTSVNDMYILFTDSLRAL